MVGPASPHLSSERLERLERLEQLTDAVRQPLGNPRPPVNSCRRR